MNTGETHDMGPELAAAILQAQLATPPLKKSKSVKAGSFSYDYCPLSSMLDTMRPVFGEHGVAILFRSWCGDMATMLACTLVHGPTGQRYEVALPISLPEDAKEAGSKITYWKRYLLGIATGITAEEDDDGGAASGGSRARQTRPRQSGPGVPDTATADATVGGGKKGAAIQYITDALVTRFGEGPPWEPLAKAQVLKDVYGTGKWADVLALSERVLTDALKPKLHPSLHGVSRFEYTMGLVEDGKRRPESCEPHDWPQKLAAGAIAAEGE